MVDHTSASLGIPRFISKTNRFRVSETRTRADIEQCKAGRIAECRVIEVLADHAECLHEDHVEPV